MISFNNKMREMKINILTGELQYQYGNNKREIVAGPESYTARTSTPLSLLHSIPLIETIEMTRELEDLRPGQDERNSGLGQQD